jgi:putative oxygen-independent coproporphyrinogen III oxidase
MSETRPIELPPLALYVHLPWCRRKCPYCDFSSYVAESALPERLYVDALLADLEAELPRAAGREVASVFVGGGTPSLFSPAEVARLMAGIRARVALAPEAEVTLEANPGTLECQPFAGFRAAGVNRISLGAQSFQAAALAALGRIHGPGDTLAAVLELKAAGFGNFNLDLMHGLPGQTQALAREDLEAALGQGAPHLSYYQLTLEPGTPFARHPPVLPDEDEIAEREVAAHAQLEAAGYERYEISALARPGHRCRHNLNYWEYGDYLGIGAGAHGKLSSAEGIERREKPRHPQTYLKATLETRSLPPPRAIPPAERPFEFWLNALRLREGATARSFEARTGLLFSSIAAVIEREVGRGLLSVSEGRVAPTPAGWRFLNDLQAAFLPASPRARGGRAIPAPSPA